MSGYLFINQHFTRYPVRRLCQVLGVALSRYYAWQQRQQQALGPQEPAWEVALDQTFERHKKRYGTRRLRVALCQQGHCVGRQALRTAMRRRGLRALQPKAYTPRALFWAISSTNPCPGTAQCPGPGNACWLLSLKPALPTLSVFVFSRAWSVATPKRLIPPTLKQTRP